MRSRNLRNYCSSQKMCAELSCVREFCATKARPKRCSSCRNNRMGRSHCCAEGREICTTTARPMMCAEFSCVREFCATTASPKRCSSCRNIRMVRSHGCAEFCSPREFCATTARQAELRLVQQEPIQENMRAPIEMSKIIMRVSIEMHILLRRICRGRLVPKIDHAFEISEKGAHICC